jgi:iron-sulfur cluster assembly protein
MALAAKRRQTQADGPEHQPLDPVRVLVEGEPRQGPAEIRLTPKAVEMARKALEKRGTPAAALRLGVRGGGCSGVSYAIEFSDSIRKKDNVFEYPNLHVVVDPKSLVYLRGSVLDYEVQLMQHGFKFRNPNEKAGCGCGESFSI